MIIQKLNEKKNKSEKNISSSSEMNPCKNSLIYYLESENKLECNDF